MVGRVCTTPGTEGPLFSRENYPGGPPGINGNADWVRGNRFGVNYSEPKIDNRVDYSYKTSLTKRTNPQYVQYDPFYPKPGRCRTENCWFKTYPQYKRYNQGGYPTWEYPYQTTQPGSRDPAKVVKRANTVGDVVRIMENFSDGLENTQRCKTVFWVGAFVLMGSLLYQTKMR
jgi:hypothetical protein